MTNEGWLLMADERRKARSMTHDKAEEFLHEFIEDDLVGPACATALHLVEERNADPRFFAVLIQRAMDGAFWQVGDAVGHGNGRGRNIL